MFWMHFRDGDEISQMHGDNVGEIEVSRVFEVPKTQMCYRAEENVIQQKKKKKKSRPR